jgi:hypothetical protein
VSPVRYELEFYIPEDGILHSHRRESLKSYNILTASVFLIPCSKDSILFVACLTSSGPGHIVCALIGQITASCKKASRFYSGARLFAEWLDS